MSLPNPINVTYVSPQSGDTFPFIYIVKDTDNIINIDTTHGAVHVILRNIRNSGMLQYQSLLSINDGGNNASANNITIYPSEGDVINDNTSYVLTNNGANSILQISGINQWVVAATQNPIPFEGLNYVYVYGNGATPLENGQQFLDGYNQAVAKKNISNPTITFTTFEVAYSEFPDDGYDPLSNFNYWESAIIPAEQLEPYLSNGDLVYDYNAQLININGIEYPCTFENWGSEEEPEYRIWGVANIIPSVGIYNNVVFSRFKFNVFWEGTLIIGNGDYEFDETVEINDEYMNICSLSEHSQVNFTFTNASTIGVNILKDYVTLKGINVVGRSIQINSENNKNILIENCVGGDNSFSGDIIDLFATFKNCVGGDESFGYETDCKGEFINCVGGERSFGYNADCVGNFQNCWGGSYSFAAYGTCSGLFVDCQNDIRNLFEDFQSYFSAFGNASGTFTRCGGVRSRGVFASVGQASGRFIDCIAGDSSYAIGGTASGRFYNCKGGFYSFGYIGQAFGTFINCCGSELNSFSLQGGMFGSNNGVSPSSTGGTYINCTALGSNNFGSGSVGTDSNGYYYNCVGSEDSFGGIATGYFVNCIGGNNSFGSVSASGIFVNCVAEGQSFGGTNATGRFNNCVGGSGAFGRINASGRFTNCVGGVSSFGGGIGGTLTGKLFYCNLTSGTFRTVSGSGRTRLCIDGNDTQNNQG
jgi:hypothetical protein